MKRTIAMTYGPAVLMILVFALVSCGGGDVAVVYDEISGAVSVSENSPTDFSIKATGPKSIGYAWVVEPASAGVFTNGNRSQATFTPAEVTSDTVATIKVMMTANSMGPWVASKEIAILDTDQQPNAAASADRTKIGHGESVKFTDESTDPEGDNDIVKWGWDFSYEEPDGFCCDCEDRNPVQTFDTPGIYTVMLCVTDRSGISDMLQEPIVIEVIENYAPVITSVTRNRTTSRMGNANEAVALALDFSDPSPADDVHTISWSCGHGSFDDPSIQNPVWFPPDYEVDCDISVTVTDMFGLSDNASCHQWVTSLPVLINNSAPGNLIIPNDFDTVFSGTINPANWVFPNDAADGNVVFMSFWATWSSGCVQGMPTVLSVNDMFSVNPDYRHVMINESEPVEDVFSFIYHNSYDAMYWALDEDTSYFNTANGWNGDSNFLPQHLLFDRDGRCRWSQTGKLTSTTELEGYIGGLL